MRENDVLAWESRPIFLDRAEELMEYMRGMSLEEAQSIWKCNDRIADLNYRRFQEMDLRRNLSAAILSYEGIQYQYMAPGVFDRESLSYVQEHLRILSGFYGVLRPLDGVVPYRLEMQAGAGPGGCRDLYEFWADRIFLEVYRQTDTVLNLASREYSRCVEKYRKKGNRFVTCVFGEWNGRRVIQKGTQAKMARGEMVRYLAGIRAEKPEAAKAFTGLGYEYREELSSDTEYVFLKREKEKG